MALIRFRVAILDVADSRAVSQAAVSAHEALGRIDVLVNSAGITGATAPLHEFPVDNWIRVIEVNLHGTFYCCRAVFHSCSPQGTAAW